MFINSVNNKGIHVQVVQTMNIFRTMMYDLVIAAFDLATETAANSTLVESFPDHFSPRA